MNNTNHHESESIRKVIDQATDGLVDRETLVELIVLGAVASQFTECVSWEFEFR